MPVRFQWGQLHWTWIKRLLHRWNEFEQTKSVRRKGPRNVRRWQNLPCQPSWQRQRLTPAQMPWRHGRWHRWRWLSLPAGMTSQWSPLKPAGHRHLLTPRHRPPFRHGITHFAVEHVIRTHRWRYSTVYQLRTPPKSATPFSLCLNNGRGGRDYFFIRKSVGN